MKSVNRGQGKVQKGTASELTETDKTKNITKAKLLQIARYVRDVFSIQPTRRYIHAFILRENVYATLHHISWWPLSRPS